MIAVAGGILIVIGLALAAIFGTALYAQGDADGSKGMKGCGCVVLIIIALCVLGILG